MKQLMKNATVEVTKDNDNVEGVTTVVVTAEDGISTKTYSIEIYPTPQSLLYN